jgi:hypothetical protein
LFAGRTAEELRRAILARRTSGLKGHQVALRRIGARRLAMQQVRGLSVTPKKVLGPHVRRVRGMVRR